MLFEILMLIRLCWSWRVRQASARPASARLHASRGGATGS